MKIICDANIFLATLLNEPEKMNIISATKESVVISPNVLPYEIGNSLISLYKRKRINKTNIIKIYELFTKIPIRLVDINMKEALNISIKYNIYAYDSYYLEVAKRMQLSLLTLDKKMISIAKEISINVLEVI